MYTLIFLGVVVIFILYLLIDFIASDTNTNSFFDKWAKRLVWLWLPFYAFFYLIKEVAKKKQF